MRELTIEIFNRKIRNLADFKKLFNDLKDGKYRLTIKDFRKRSLQQNAYYWGVVVPMVKEGLRNEGFDEVTEDEEAHEIIKHLHLKKMVVSKNTGDCIELGGSTAKLSITEFNELIERVCKWAAEYLNIVIPSPNEELVILNDYVDHLEIIS